MILEFIDTLPEDTPLNPVLISGSVSAEYSNQQFIRVRSDKHTIRGLYEIRYEHRCSPFKEILLVENLLAVGHEEHFYLVDLTTNELVLRLQMDGYFGHLYEDEKTFYVADASSLHCIEQNGAIHWNSMELAVNGVVIHEITENKILGSGDFDPPGDWIDFTLDKKTGTKTA